MYIFYFIYLPNLPYVRRYMYALVYYICTYMSMCMYYLEASSKELGIDWYRYRGIGIDWYRYKLVHV